MLILDYKQILDKHKNREAFVCAHGPSLRKYTDVIEKKQKDGSIRISVNNWSSFFTTPPEYCCIANAEYTIKEYINYSSLKETTFFYADSADMTSRKEVIESELSFFGYDQRHFKNNDCRKILSNYDASNNKNNFIDYGNNIEMWLDNRLSEYEWAGFDRHGRCCHQIIKNRPTVQEYLQKISNTNKHYSTGDTVTFHAISFAIIMGCNPIYVAGLDLDYSLGYSNGDLCPYVEDEWHKFKRNTFNDLKILNDSAKNRKIKLINLTENPWYGNIIECEKL